MRTFLLSILTVFIANAVYSQCDAPVVESWTVFDNMNYTINFIPPQGAQSYNLTVSYDYGLVDSIPSTPIIITGNTVNGLNTTTFNIASFDNTMTDFAFSYFTVKLSVTCSNGDESSINKFYVSPISLAGDPSINLGDNYFKPFVRLNNVIPGDSDPNELGYIETNLSIPISGFTNDIQDISVFIDLCLLDVKYEISLTSPLGTTVQLTLPPDTNQGLSLGLSVLFQDFAAPFQLGPSDYTYGIYAPDEPLSIFEGENPNGIWNLKIYNLLWPSSDNSVIDGMLFGVALNISAPCDASMQGNVYFDSNSNSTQDDNESGFGNAIINNSVSSQPIITSNDGHFLKCFLPGNGMLSVINTPLYHTVADLPYNLALGESLTNLDFPLIPEAGNHDLKIDIFAATPDRPGFESQYKVSFKNIGTECINDIDINIELDDLFVITSASNPAVTFSGSSATISLEIICPYEEVIISLDAQLTGFAILGAELESSATIFPLSGDENPIDNSCRFKSIVVGSYDPNDKAASKETINPAFAQSNQALKYVIRFQNTGTYQAERVVIIDTLDANLDINSFQLIAASPMFVFN